MGRYRIRSVKPEAFQHRKVGRLSISARWLWVGMLAHADDDGRLVADHGQLRLLVFGYDHDVTDSKVGEWLGEIAETGLVVLYDADADGERFAYFPDWHEHQRIDRPKPSTLPEPPNPRPHRATGRKPTGRPPGKSALGKRPHRKTGRIPSGRPAQEKRPATEERQHSEGLPSTTDQRDVADASPTDRRVDRIGIGSGSDQLHRPDPPAADTEPNGLRSLTGKTQKPTTSGGEIRAVFDAYCSLFLAKVGAKPDIVEGKDGTIVKALLGRHGLDSVLARLRDFFASADPFIVQSGYTIGVFRSQFNKLLVGRNGVHLSPKTAGNVEAVRRFADSMRGTPA